MAFNNNITPGSPPLLWSNIDEAFAKINENFESLVATIGDGSGLIPVDFSSLSTDVSPSSTGTWGLGNPILRWRDLFLTSTLYLGNASITSDGGIVQLPAGSKVGDLLLDESYFKTISVSGQSDIVADIGSDTFTIANGTGIEVTTNATSDTLTITNAGVTGLTGTPGQIGVSGPTGNITLTNLGVTSLSGGAGITVSAASGGVTVSNAGIISVVTDPGSGISLDTSVPNVVRITNSSPATSISAFKNIAILGQDPVQADTSADTLTLVAGSGITLTTNAGTDTITITNSSSSGSQLTNGLYTVSLAADGSLDLGSGFYLNRSTISGTECLPSVDTVVYTSIGTGTRTIKLLVQFEGAEDGGDGNYHTHSCDIIAVKRTGPLGTVTVDATIYGSIYTSTAAIATFDARWNAIDSTIEITARPVSVANNGWVKVHATEVEFGGTP